MGRTHRHPTGSDEIGHFLGGLEVALVYCLSAIGSQLSAGSPLLLPRSPQIDMGYTKDQLLARLKVCLLYPFRRCVTHRMSACRQGSKPILYHCMSSKCFVFNDVVAYRSFDKCTWSEVVCSLYLKRNNSP